ncbi:MAG: DUF4861 family protein [Chitinispirillaceae bacterium]|nr:DUF4861 family protein [Chitinispirillaceae bacterium]
MNTRCALSICIVIVTFLSAYTEPVGALLMHENKRYGHYNVPGDAAHHYFNLLEGPAWENKYCAFRMYIDMDDRNAIDIFGKLKEGSFLQNFNDASDDPHAIWSWGTDILKVGSAMGLGSFRLFNNGQWINPQLPETIDSLVITIADSSVETPQVRLGYYGWNIGNGNKITVFWTISTTFEERAVHCELSIEGNYSGKVVAGMVNHNENTDNPNRQTVSVIRDEEPPLLATLGKQSALPEGYTDSLLMAIYTESSYFDSFVKDGTTNLGMVLTPDEENKVRWSFAYSCVCEVNPLFRHADWKKTLIPPTSVDRQFTVEQSYPVSGNTSTMPALVYSLDGRVFGKMPGNAVLPGQCSNGVYVINRKSGGNNGSGLTHYKVNSLFSR